MLRTPGAEAKRIAGESAAAMGKAIRRGLCMSRILELEASVAWHPSRQSQQKRRREGCPFAALRTKIRHAVGDLAEEAPARSLRVSLTKAFMDFDKLSRTTAHSSRCSSPLLVSR